MQFLLDSVILIDHLNNMPQATKWLTEFHAKSCLSVISRAEILAGVNSNELKNVKLFLGAFLTIAFNVEDADLAATLRQTHRWKLPDAMQAALAINHGLILVTRNTKDFSVKKHEFCQVPYKI